MPTVLLIRYDCDLCGAKSDSIEKLSALQTPKRPEGWLGISGLAHRDSETTLCPSCTEILRLFFERERTANLPTQP